METFKPYHFDLVACSKCQKTYVGIAVNGLGIISAEHRYCERCGALVCNKCYNEKLDRCRYCK